METETQFPADGEFVSDADMIAELLDDVDAFAGMIERVRAQVAKGKDEVRLVPRGQLYTVAQALDELGDAMIRRTLQVRAQRTLRDGVADSKMNEVLGELDATNELEKT